MYQYVYFLTLKRKVATLAYEGLNKFVYIYVFFTMSQQPPVDQGLLIVEYSRSHSDTPHSVGLLWTSDQPVAETST